jgi:hypothetical protein
MAGRPEDAQQVMAQLRLVEVPILGKPYITGYEPIRDADSHIIGVYYVGYLKK